LTNENPKPGVKNVTRVLKFKKHKNSTVSISFRCTKKIAKNKQTFYYKKYFESSKIKLTFTVLARFIQN
jgi:hypothetical protein